MSIIPLVLGHVLVVSLVIVLMVRISRLSRSGDSAFAVADTEWRDTAGFSFPFGTGRKRADFNEAEALTQAQMLTGIQLRDARRRGLKLEEHRRQEPHLLAGCYFFGISRAITHARGGTETDAERIARFLMNRNLALDIQETDASIARVSRDETALSCFHRGVQSADSWTRKGYTPEENSLFEAVTSQVLV